MVDFFFGVGVISDSNSVQRQNSPIEAQNRLPMSRMTLEHCNIEKNLH